MPLSSWGKTRNECMCVYCLFRYYLPGKAHKISFVPCSSGVLIRQLLGDVHIFVLSSDKLVPVTEENTCRKGIGCTYRPLTSCYRCLGN